MAIHEYGVYGDALGWWMYLMATTHRIPAAVEVQRINKKSVTGPWEETLNDGPYLIFWYRLSPDQPTVTTTLNIDIDGVLAYSAQCHYQDNLGPNYDFLIGGNIFTTDSDLDKSVSCMVAQNSIRLFGNDSCDIDYQIIKFALREAA